MNEIRFSRQEPPRSFSKQEIRPQLSKSEKIDSRERFGLDREKVYEEAERNKKSYKGFRFLIFIFCILAIIFGLIMAFVFGFRMWKSGSMSNVYSAVFLTNGQVYFGKIMNKNSDEISLKDVYYIQQDSALNEDSLSVKASTTPKTKFEIIKLGSEVYGPTDEIFISLSQVMFYENLRDDSKVVLKIKSLK